MDTENNLNEELEDKIERLRAEKEATDTKFNSLLDETLDFTEAMEVTENESEPLIGAEAIVQEEEVEAAQVKEKKPFPWLFSGIAFFTVVLAVVIVYFVVYPERWNSITGTTDEKEVVNNEGLFDASEAEYTELADETANTDTAVITEPEITNNTATTGGGASKETSTVNSGNNKAQTNTSGNQQNVAKWGLPKPCYLISHSAYGEESKAMQQTAKIQKLGFDAGYYWIPDFVASGPKLYKVYIGPFSTRTAAEAALPGVKKVKADAYVVSIN